VVGAVSTVGYLGFVVGPSLVGFVADRAGLRWGLVMLAAAAMLVAVAPYRRRAAGLNRRSARRNGR
jgi:MFS family permease